MENEDDDNNGKFWFAHEDGASVGERGGEGGLILRDEEFGDDETDDARLTLERLTDENTFALTAVVYGWMHHVWRVTHEADAAFAEAKSNLESLAALLPYEDDHNIEEKARRLNAAVEDFAARFSDRR
jgi:hypothetical protein